MLMLAYQGYIRTGLIILQDCTSFWLTQVFRIITLVCNLAPLHIYFYQQGLQRNAKITQNIKSLSYKTVTLLSIPR